MYRNMEKFKKEKRKECDLIDRFAEFEVEKNFEKVHLCGKRAFHICFPFRVR